MTYPWRASAPAMPLLAERQESADLNDLIDQALVSLAPLAEKHGIRLVGAPAQKSMRVRVVPDRVKQVLIQLVVSAILVSEPGDPVLVASRVHQGQAMVQIIDRGPGITAEAEKALLRGHELPMSRIEGLMLAECRQIILEQGGDFGLRSQLGLGSTFFFSLPLVGP